MPTIGFLFSFAGSPDLQSARAKEGNY